MLSKIQFASLVRDMPDASDDEILAEAKKREGGSSTDEPGFKDWYAKQAQQHDLNPDPDAPDQHYDYRAAFKAKASPDASGHWPSTFKKEGHTNMVVGGFNTKTGEREPGTPQASEAELVKLGWDAADAKRMSRSTLRKAWDKANEPLTNAPSRVAKKAADIIDHPSRDRDPVTAAIQGFKAGAVEGLGNVADSLTSPLNLALTLAGGAGAAAGRRGFMGISKAARAVEAGLQAPMVISGGANVAEGVKDKDLGKVGAGALEAGMGAAGVHSSFKHSFPVQKVAETFGKEHGIAKETLKPHTPVKVDPAEAKTIADAYEGMKNSPGDPDVAASYDALKDEVKKQFLFIRDRAGLKMTPSKANYPNSKAMVADVERGNNLNFYPSEEGFGTGQDTSGHPMLDVDPDTGLSYNDMFRAVHDYFGHAKEGHQFGPNGEENAWLTHVKMFSKDAQPAMTSETRGQNSWVNAGPHLRNADGSVPKKGEPGYVAPQDRPFAEQKAGLLPEELRSRRDGGGQATPVAARPVPGESVGETAQGSVSPSAENEVGSTSTPVYDLPEAASTVAQLTRENGGSTFNLHKGNLNGTPHYAVSVYPERGRIVPGEATPEQIGEFIQSNQDLLSDPANSIGTWFHEGKTHLDVSKTFDDLQAAMHEGQAKNQIAIFDLQKFEDIPLHGAPQVTEAPGGAGPEFQSVEGGTAAQRAGSRVAPFESDTEFVRRLRREGKSVKEINALRRKRKAL